MFHVKQVRAGESSRTARRLGQIALRCGGRCVQDKGAAALSCSPVRRACGACGLLVAAYCGGVRCRNSVVPVRKLAWRRGLRHVVITGAFQCWGEGLVDEGAEVLGEDPGLAG